jgi:hypothetical protein
MGLTGNGESFEGALREEEHGGDRQHQRAQHGSDPDWAIGDVQPPLASSRQAIVVQKAVPRHFSRRVLVIGVRRRDGSSPGNSRRMPPVNVTK